MRKLTVDCIRKYMPNSPIIPIIFVDWVVVVLPISPGSRRFHPAQDQRHFSLYWMVSDETDPKSTFEIARYAASSQTACRSLYQLPGWLW